MTLADVAHYRLIHQHIANTRCKTPSDVVSAMGAIQAQDYLASLWAVGLRLPRATEFDIEKEIADRKIIRTWPMRGTLHLVAAHDVRWMLSLLTPRVISRGASIYKEKELTESVFIKSKNLLIKALQGGKSLTRESIYKILEKGKIATEGQRGLSILSYLAMKGLICFGERQGKQHTFVLLDEWLPESKTIVGDEALAELALRYFKSRGPATVYDLAGWSGLSVTEIQKAIELVKEELSFEKIEEKVYWFKSGAPEIKIKSIHLLPAFDEFLIAYRDKSTCVDKKFMASVLLKNGIFNPVIVREGRVEGTWKRNFVKDKVAIEIHPFGELKKQHHVALIKEAKRYCRFLDKSLEMPLITL